MSVEVNLFRLSDEDSRPELIGPVKFKEKGSLLELRKLLEGAGIVDWPFHFWYREENLRIRRKLEGLNSVGMEVFLIDELSQPGSKRRRVEAVDDNLVGSVPCQTDKDVTVELSEGSDICESSRVNSVVTDERGTVNHLRSVLLSKKTMEKYKEHEKKLRKELALICLDDHIWRMCSWDSCGVGLVKLFCEECGKYCGGRGGRGGLHGISAIQNLFASFKNNHLKSDWHIRNWCRRNRLSFADHPQSASVEKKLVILTAADHESLVNEGLEIMKCVNDGVEGDGGPFLTIGDPDADRSYLFKVKCKLCGELFQLCPPKKNLAANLNNHLQLKHSKQAARSLAINSSGNKKVVQKDLHSWFKRKSTWIDEATSRYNPVNL